MEILRLCQCITRTLSTRGLLSGAVSFLFIPTVPQTDPMGSFPHFAHLQHKTARSLLQLPLDYSPSSGFFRPTGQTMKAISITLLLHFTSRHPCSLAVNTGPSCTATSPLAIKSTGLSFSGLLHHLFNPNSHWEMTLSSSCLSPLPVLHFLIAVAADAHFLYL